MKFGPSTLTFLAISFFTMQAVDAANSHVQSSSLVGQWQVGTITDPEGGPPVAIADLVNTLLLADLPSPGAVVTINSKEICGAPEPNCRSVEWTRSTLDKELGGNRLSDALKLHPHTTVYVGDLGNRFHFITLIQRPDGHLLAHFALCQANATNCRNGFEEWIPANNGKADSQ